MVALKTKLIVTQEQMESRVQKGVKLLNKKCPGWYKKIKLNKLDLYEEKAHEGNGDKACILGQLYGNFWTATEGLGIRHPTSDPYNGPLDAGAPYGLSFTCKVLDKFMKIDSSEKLVKDHYKALTNVWKDAIKTLRS